MKLLEKITLFFILSIELSCSKTDFNENELPTAKNGVLDLRNWDFEKNGPISLEGEWLFYWKQLIPEDQIGTDALLAVVPSHWTKYKKNGKNLDPFGYGTYQLEVLLPENINPDLLGFKVHAYENNVVEIDFNDKNSLQTGIVEKNGYKNKLIDWKRDFILPIKIEDSQESKLLKILIRTSNYSNDGPGLTISPSIGLINSLRFNLSVYQFYSSVIIGLLLMVFLYEFIGFLLNINNISYLLLSMVGVPQK